MTRRGALSFILGLILAMPVPAAAQLPTPRPADVATLEIHRETRRFGNIAHVFSTYESRNTPDGPVIARGINSLNLFWDGSRWWIASATWDEERPGNRLPREYLPPARE